TSLPLALQLVPSFHRRQQLFVNRGVACRQPRAFGGVFGEDRAIFKLRTNGLLLRFQRGDLRRQRIEFALILERQLGGALRIASRRRPTVFRRRFLAGFFLRV